MKKYNKKGDVWVSAVLYFGLGIVVLTLILSAGMPVVNRLKDKNIAVQTKDVFAVLDSNIREVARGGPGTQRILQLEMQKGEITVYDAENGENVNNNLYKAILNISVSDPIIANTPPNRIVWNYQGKAAVSEPGMLVPEGNTKILTTGGKGSYDVRFWLDYEPSIYLRIGTAINTLSGGTRINIKNSGAGCKIINPNAARGYEPDTTGTNAGKCSQDTTTTPPPDPRTTITITPL